MDEQGDGDHGGGDLRRARLLRRLLGGLQLTLPCSSISTAANAARLKILKKEKRWRRSCSRHMETTLLHVPRDGEVVPITSGPERVISEVGGPQAWEGL